MSARIAPVAATEPRSSCQFRSKTEQVISDFAATEKNFDVIIFVANIHHQPLREALGNARQLLRPGSELAVVGLAANTRLRRETSDVGVPITEPEDSLAQIRRVADDVVPGAVIRRGLWYLLHRRNE